MPVLLDVRATVLFVPVLLDVRATVLFVPVLLDVRATVLFRHMSLSFFERPSPVYDECSGSLYTHFYSWPCRTKYDHLWCMHTLYLARAPPNMRS